MKSWQTCTIAEPPRRRARSTQVLAGLDRSRVERQVIVALAQARAGHTEPAILTLGTALERTPDDPRVYQALGQVWLQDAETRNDRLALNKAIEALERAGSGATATSETLTLFGRALLRDGQTDRAEQVLQLATTRYPVDPSAFLHYATAAERQKHLDTARQALIDLAALQGDDADMTDRATRIAALSTRLNDPASAARWLQKAVDAGGKDAKLLASLADAQLKPGTRMPRRRRWTEAGAGRTAASCNARRRLKSVPAGCFGSVKSRNPSPRKLNPSTSSAIARPGNTVRCGASSKCTRPPLSIVPQLGVGG